MSVKGVFPNGLLVLICWLPLLSFAETIVHEVVPLEDRIRLLQSGGHIMVMRHGATDHSQKDLDRSLEPDCSKQRDLSDQGREEMRYMRRSLIALQIPIGKVYASPYCRTRHTAEEAFVEYQVDPDLQFSISKDSVEAKRLADYLYRSILSANPGSANSVIITHTSNIRDALGIWPKPEGAVLVIQNKESGMIYRGVIKPYEWPGP